MKDIKELKEDRKESVSREQTIIRTSVIGIAANVMLAAFKAVVGVLTNSIAIVLDAVNNISDAGNEAGRQRAGQEASLRVRAH